MTQDRLDRDVIVNFTCGHSIPAGEEFGPETGDRMPCPVCGEWVEVSRVDPATR